MDIFTITDIKNKDTNYNMYTPVYDGWKLVNANVIEFVRKCINEI